MAASDDNRPPMSPPLSLGALGISAGERVRFRRGVGRSWNHGVATGVEKDGSLGLRDSKGAARAIVLKRVEVVIDGQRGAPRWEPLLDVAARTEQLRLFCDGTSPME